MSGFKMADYVDVAERIVEFRTKHPEGSLQQLDIQFIDFAGKSWVVFTAAAYRDADDNRPGMGTAWEPVPGPTQFTRDSEVQNAETAAWGRAIVAVLAADTKRGVASAQEVQNRSDQCEAPPPAAAPDDPSLTADQRATMFGLFNKRGITDKDAQLAGIASVIGRQVTSRGALTRREASLVIDSLTKRPANEEAP